MGQETSAERLADLTPYQVNAALVGAADPDAIVMHCLPAHRNEEITDEVIDGPQSVVFQQAANRNPAQKAIMAFLLRDAAARPAPMQGAPAHPRPALVSSAA
jgi:ornithine carbamoyltransferase